MEKPVFIPLSNLKISTYDVRPLVNYKPEKDFPNCCNYHKIQYKEAQEWFAKFPDCCDDHKKLRDSQFGFKKEHYWGVVDKIMSQVHYTEHLILERINNEDWYNDITDYFEYNLNSFGQPEVGAHLYVKFVSQYLKEKDEIPEEKEAVLLQYLSPTEPKPKGKTGVEIENDFNILFSTYQRWLKTFPFNISYFKELEPKLKKHFPIIKGKPKVNRYTGQATSKLITADEQIQFLSDLTNLLISSVSTAQLYSEGKITDIQKSRLDIANEKYRINHQAIITQYNKGERKYLKTIKAWLKNEREYFQEIADADKIPPSKPEPTKAEKLQGHLYKYGFEALQKVKDLNSSQRQSLINKLAESPLPYQIAMLDFLGFITYMRSNHTRTKEMLFKRLAEILDKPQRSISGNYRVLSPKTDEDTDRYTAHSYKETVEKDYKKLK